MKSIGFYLLVAITVVPISWAMGGREKPIITMVLYVIVVGVLRLFNTKEDAEVHEPPPIPDFMDKIPKE